MAKLILQKAASPIGFRLDFAYGTTSDLIQSGEPGKSIDYLEQAYVTAVIPLGKGITVNAGKMSTHMGAEVIESNANMNYSRSFLFAYAVPYYHVGICASYPALENLTLTGYLYNGWNISQEINGSKTLGAELNWSPSGNLTFILNWIGGAEEPDSVSTNRRDVYEAIVNYSPTSSLTFSLNGDYGSERLSSLSLALWKGAALICRYSFNDVSALAVRAEVYSDPLGFTTGTSQDLKEITVTYEHKLLSALLMRLEYRSDWSTASVFNGSKGTSPMQDQNTLLLSSVYTF
jgi:Putative beta-barrel porin-2, OmpL-like. bbp2